MKIAVAMSGGVDSSAVGALAAGALGRPVSALTVLPGDPFARKRDLGFIESLERAVPMKRLGEPEDIAAAVAFLASDEARFINGTTLVVDGARLDIL